MSVMTATMSMKSIEKLSYPSMTELQHLITDLGSLLELFVLGSDGEFKDNVVFYTCAIGGCRLVCCC